MKLPYLLFFVLFSAAHAAHAAEADACNQALEAGDAAQAVAQAQEALRTAANKRETYLCLGRAQGELNRHTQALAALEEAGKLSIQPQERMLALTLLGNAQRNAGNPAQAIVAYQQSLEIARAEKSSGFELLNLNQMGVAMQQSGDNAAALEHFRQGLALAANDNERADSHARIASAYSLLGQHDKAIEHQLKSVLYEERAGDFNHYAYANIELGRICLVARQYADAEKWLGKFLGTITEAGDSYWQAKARYMLARVKSAKGAGTEAREQFSQAKAMAQRIGANTLLGEITQAESAM